MFILFQSFVFFLLQSLSVLSFTKIMGSWGVYFKGTMFGIPALAAGGWPAFVVWFGIRMLQAKNIYMYSIYRLPTFVSSLGYFSGLRFFKIAYFCCAFMAFIIHPIGMQVWWYGLYWFIPLLTLLLLKENAPLQQAVVTTFLAHATGSLIWLYGYNLDPMYWRAAALLVPFERCIHIVGLRVVQCCIQKSSSYFKHRFA